MANQKNDKTNLTVGRAKNAKHKKKKGKILESPKKAAANSSKNNRVKSSRLKDEIAAIILLAVGIFLLVSMYTKMTGSIGLNLSKLFKGMFGHGALGLPFILIIYSLIIFIKANRPFRPRTVILLSISFLLIDLINAARFIEKSDFGLLGIVDIYKEGVDLKSGGVFGMYTDKLLHELIGITGIYISCATGLLICLLLLINTPISKALENRRQRRDEKKARRRVEASRRAKNPDITSEQKPKTEFSIPSYGEEETQDKKDESDVFKLAAEEEFGERNKKDSEKGGFHNEAETPEDIKRETEIVEIRGRKSLEADNTNYKLPGIDLLEPPVKSKVTGSERDELKNSAAVLEETLKSFKVNARVVNVTRGSSVTRYEIQPDVGVKVNSIARLADDIALNLRAKSIRIEAPIPGKAAVGIEIENANRQMVNISEIIASDEFQKSKSELQFAVGKDIAGNPVVADLAKMPHLLIAGATGAGKSVCINTIITSLLYNATPDEVKLVLIDPKMVELGNYNGIPHLLIPVVTDSTKAAAALNWAVGEMTRRYKEFAKEGVRDIRAYNNKMKRSRKDPIPKIVVIIDELADLMMVASSQVEEAICRLAQLARAAGMHLIVATQRPSVDVITGLIKANITSRIAFMVSSQIDSRTIIDGAGAEKLVGNGDMLFKPQDKNKPIRLQGPFISDKEVNRIIEFTKQQVKSLEYSEEVISKISVATEDVDDERDQLFDEAVSVVIEKGQASVSMLQRRFRIGYNRAARLIDALEQAGVVGPHDGARPRSVLLTSEEWEEKKRKAKEGN